MSDLTTRAIMDALVDLLKKKPFSKITVKDIVTECGINRNTFYYHFEDIYDLLDKTFQYEMKKANIQSITLDNWQEKVDELLIKVQKYKTVGLHIFHSVDTKDMVRYIRRMYLGSLKNALDPLFTKLNLAQRDQDFFLHCLCNALVGFSLEWAEHSFDEAFFRKDFVCVSEWLQRLSSLESNPR